MTAEEAPRLIANDEQSALFVEASLALKELGIYHFDHSNPFAIRGVYTSVVFSRDIHNGSTTIHAGAYYIRIGSDGVPELNAPLFVAVVDPSSLGDVIETADNAEEDEQPKELTIRVHYEQTGYNLPMLTILAAIEYAEDDGLRSRLLEAFAEPVEALPKQDAIKPTTHVEAISKLANEITNDLLYSGEFINLDVSGKRERGVKTVVSLSFESNDVELSKPMTPFDRTVHNAVATLWHEGVRTFTTRQVWYAMTGKDKQPNKEQAERLEKSLDKQRFTRAVVDFTAEARGRRLKLDGEPLKSCTIDAYMLNAEKVDIESANGRKVTGYVINKPPVLYWQASSIGQVATYPVRMLDTSDVMQDTDENIVIKSYLLNRIELMRGKSKLSNRIRYETVYEQVGVDSPDKKQRKRINDTVCRLLDHWASMGHIKGYTEYKEKGGRMRAGVEIDAGKA